MNKTDELVIRFLTGELSAKELSSFEMKLNQSDDLKKLVKDYSVIFNKLGEQKEIESNDFYFNNLIKDFRKSAKHINPKLSFKRIAYGITILLITIISYTVFHPDRQLSESGNLELITEGISGRQISVIIDNYSLIDNADFYDTNLDTLFDIEMNSVYKSAAMQAADDMQIEELTNRLSENEINQVYADLITKKIL